MTKPEAMEKVIKLLALSKQDGPEGSTANEKAKELMVTHKIAVADLVSYEKNKQSFTGPVEDFTETLLKGLWELLYPFQKLQEVADGAGVAAATAPIEDVTKKLIWCAEGGLVKRWVAVLADYVCEAYDCFMWRNNGLWAAGTASNLKSAQSALEALVAKLEKEAKEEYVRRGSEHLNWLQSWRLGRVEEIGTELIKAKAATKGLFPGIGDMLGLSEKARVQAWVRKNVEFA